MKALTTATLIAAMLAITPAMAQETASPVGLWKNIDDVTGKPKALIRISENNGEIQGKLEKLFRPEGTEQNPKCNKCEGVNKDQPILGMAIFKGPKQDAKDKAIWEGGEILDPNKGKSYRMRLRVLDDGKKLEMRGYIAFLHRDQEWIRAE